MSAAHLYIFVSIQIKFSYVETEKLQIRGQYVVNVHSPLRGEGPSIVTEEMLPGFLKLQKYLPFVSKQDKITFI